MYRVSRECQAFLTPIKQRASVTVRYIIVYLNTRVPKVNCRFVVIQDAFVLLAKLSFTIVPQLRISFRNSSADRISPGIWLPAA